MKYSIPDSRFTLHLLADLPISCRIPAGNFAGIFAARWLDYV
jgi:hypothetical protein